MSWNLQSVVVLTGSRGMFLSSNISLLFLLLLENFHHFGLVMDFLQIIDGWRRPKRALLALPLAVALR